MHSEENAKLRRDIENLKEANKEIMEIQEELNNEVDKVRS